MSPLDALSALTQAQLPTAGALNANPPAGGVPMGLTAPVSEGFNQLFQGTQAAQGVQATAPIAASGASSPTTWGHMVQQMVMDANNQQQSAAAKVSDVLQGGPTPVHEAMIASEQASLSFEFLAEVRNKITDAYQQVMQMQV